MVEHQSVCHAGHGKLKSAGQAVRVYAQDMVLYASTNALSFSYPFFMMAL